MKNLPNIEKSAFRRGEYVGYAHGVWIITRSNGSNGNWFARHRDNQRAPHLYAFTLEKLSEKLAGYAKDVPGYNSEGARLLRAATAGSPVVWSSEKGWN